MRPKRTNEFEGADMESAPTFSNEYLTDKLEFDRGRVAVYNGYGGDDDAI